MHPRSPRLRFLALAALGASLCACNTATLSPRGAQVATSQSAPVDHGYPPGSCKSLGYIVGRGGGSFGGAWISNDDLVEYAMNDLRNKAAARGANYIQHDSPQLGVAGSNGSTSTTTATVSGTAYLCAAPAKGGAPASAPAPAPATAVPQGPAPCSVAGTPQGGGATPAASP